MGLGLPEIIGIVIVVLVVFGAGRLAGVGKALGTGLREFREEARTPPGEDGEAESEGSSSPEAAAAPAAEAPAAEAAPAGEGEEKSDSA